MDFLRPGLKTGVGNGIFWSEIGSGFGDTGGTPPPKISTSTPPGTISNCFVFDGMQNFHQEERSVLSRGAHL